MSTLHYLSAVKKRLSIESDYALAKALKIRHSTICGYRAGKSRMDDDVALKIADILGLNPLEVIAAANAERAKSDEMRTVWLGLMEKMQGFLALSLHANRVRRLSPTR